MWYCLSVQTEYSVAIISIFVVHTYILQNADLVVKWVTVMLVSDTYKNSLSIIIVVLFSEFGCRM